MFRLSIYFTRLAPNLIRINGDFGRDQERHEDVGMAERQGRSIAVPGQDPADEDAANCGKQPGPIFHQAFFVENGELAGLRPVYEKLARD